MKRISEYKKPKSSAPCEVKKEKVQKLKLKLPYDLTSLLSRYNTRFHNLGCKVVRFDLSRKSINKVNRKSLERSLYTNDRNPLSVRLSRFCSLEDLELSSHQKVEMSLLRHKKLKRLSLINIGCIKHDGKPYMRSLKRLEIVNSVITPRAFKGFAKLKSLVELKIVGMKFKREISSRKIFHCLKRSKSLKSLTIECCDWKENVYYEIARVLNLNKFHFVVQKKYISFDMTVSGSSSIIFSSFDSRFYGYNCEDIRSVICIDGLIDALKLRRLCIKDLREFSTKNTKIDRFFVETFLFQFENITKLSFPGCHVDSILLHNILKKYKKTLRYLDVSCMLVPFDFLSICKRLLSHCKVIFGQESNVLEIGQIPDF